MSVKIRPYRNGGWEVDIVVKLPNGEVIRERKKSPVTSKTGTQRWAQEREMYLLLHPPQEPKPEEQPKKEVPTLADFAPRFIERYAKANRQKSSSIYAKESILRHHLLPWFGTRKLDQLQEEDVQNLKASLKEHAPKTVNNVLTVLSKLLRVAVKWQVLDRMPVTIELLKVAPPTLEFYDDEVYEQLFAAAEQTDARTALVIRLGGDAGLRIGEIIALEWADVDLRRGLLTVRRADWRGEVDTPKGNRSRQIPLTAKLASLLSARSPQGEPCVLTQDGGHRLTYKVVRNWIKAAQHRAGMPETGKLHVLRHTFCSRLSSRSAPAKAIQELAGHTTLAVTQRYMHLSPAEREGAIRLLDQPVGVKKLGD